MKKIIIVNNNMKVGGVQKSLCNLLHAMAGKYDITLYLFRAEGACMDMLPAGVKVVACTGLFRYLGMSQGDCRKLSDRLKRGALAAVCRLFGRPAAMKLLLAGQKKLPGDYDCAISFLHNGNRRSFYGGVQDFVLHRVSAAKKVAFLHCDYRSCGGNHKANNRDMERFDCIAACSDGCRRAFLEVLPQLERKCVTVRNCHQYDEIRSLAEKDPVSYEDGLRNVVMVTRLAHEKAVERGIRAVACSRRQGIPAALHIVGGGPMEDSLRSLAKELKIEEYVRFYGEQSNPYRFLKQADLFLLTSYHEAAPMVVEEACGVGLPVLTAATTSSREMVEDRGCGWVCENSQEGLDQMLAQILAEPEALARVRANIADCPLDNSQAEAQFITLIEG